MNDLRSFLTLLKERYPEEIVVIQEPVEPDFEITAIVNDLERRTLREEKRRVNIDPGYVALERLVLATGKNYTHRMYLSKGIYADLTLVFHQGSFQTLAWTYRDYADPVVIGYFNNIREHYKNQLRGLAE